MLTPKARGELSERLFEALRSDSPTWTAVHETTPTDADDAQIALWTLYELSYQGLEEVSEEREWDPDALRIRRQLEVSFEGELRARFVPPKVVEPFADALFGYVEEFDGPSLAAEVQRDASAESVLELLRHRSIYHLKESDPTSWVVPRLPYRPKAALMELQYDEYGEGDPNRLHSHLFARGLEACGLSAEYGAYVNDVPMEILAQNNVMSLFGLHRRLRAAALGHLAAFETTSSVPSRRIVQGLERLGLPAEMIGYYEEHVEADAIHEQLAVRTICGSLIEAEPTLVDDIFFGAFTCLDLEARYATHLLGATNS